MICALCNEKEADKKNTHYLTDGVIRSALNFDGSNDREAGVMYDLSNDKPSVEFNFQRNTPPEKIEEILERIPTEQEIEAAKKIPFSVDNIFCSSCESIFTAIENPFLQSLLPLFRGRKFSKSSIFNESQHKITRLFLYLQIWRSAICTKSINISDETLEDLRKIIFNHNSKSLSDIIHYPLSLTYLTTDGDSKNYTSNLVGMSNDRNPFIIHLNDFVIQFYESVDRISFLDYYGLNNIEVYEKYVNTDEGSFIIDVLSDKERIRFNTAVGINTKLPQLIDSLKRVADLAFFETFRRSPPPGFSKEYIRRVIMNPNERKFSIEKTHEVLHNFLHELIRNSM